MPDDCGRPEIVANVRKRIGMYYKDKRRAVFYELGLNSGGTFRADIYALAMNGYGVVVEIKSCVSDFTTDKKMHNYLEFCNQAYVAMPESVYKKVKDRVVEGFGVFVLTEDGKYIKKVIKSKVREIDVYTSMSLAIRAAFRTSEFSTRKNKVLV